MRKGLRVMHSKGMVKGLPNCSFEFDFYEQCIYQKKLSEFPKISYKRKRNTGTRTQ